MATRARAGTTSRVSTSNGVSLGGSSRGCVPKRFNKGSSCLFGLTIVAPGSQACEPIALKWQPLIFRFGWARFRGFLKGHVLSREVYRLAGEQIGNREQLQPRVLPAPGRLNRTLLRRLRR